ncbi:MAG: DUF6175 family protein [Saprospiraceae bacterium]|nr:DUF6175 family protein [Saprospiraceae bacterium]
MFRKHIFTLLFMGLVYNTVAQDSKPATEAPRTIQPSIMVIPFARENQDMRKVLENDINLRVAVTKVKEGFDKRGFSTVDFVAKSKLVNNDKAMEMNNLSSLKQQIIELSGADIYVETEANVNRTDGGNSITVIVTAYDAFSGLSLANKVGNSPKFYTDNFEKLAEKAAESIIEDFLNTMQSKFDEIVKNGRIAALNITFSENATTDMDTEVGDTGQMFSELMEKWLEENTFKGYFHLQGVTATKMIVDELRLPFQDANGNNYRPTKFAAELRNYLKKMGFESTRDVQGSKIFITIN